MKTQYAERERTVKFNCKLPDKRSLTQIFHETVCENGSKTAISAENHKLTYEELDKKSNQVANMLCRNGVQREDIVAIFVDKSIRTIVSIFGILKAGAAYLPIDILLPDTRIEYMLTKGKANYLLNSSIARKETQDRLKQHGIQEIDMKQQKTYPDTAVDMRQGNQTLAYVMFTSGSQGNPKGVMIEDRGIIRLVVEETYFPFEQGWNILQSGTLVFDASVFDVYGALLNGATLHLIENNVLLNAEKLKQQILRNQIDMMFLTTPLFHQMVRLDVSIFEQLNYLVVGGDVLLPKYARILKEHVPKIHLFNGYGPTENTTFSTFYEVPQDVPENIPIGKPICYSTAYILDDKKEKVKDGETGELYVGGEGVGRGYSNEEKLTGEKFIPDPCTGETMYRTGDLARMLPDGNIEFVGRCDTQIKLRGFRIEVQEVQNIINSQNIVKECFVMCEAEGDDKRLAAYVVLQEATNKEELCGKLKNCMPVYMIPEKLIVLEKLPLNLNGKVDKQQLLEIRQEVTSQEEIADENDLAVSILNKQLKRKVSLHSNLYEIGFNSISAIKVLTELNKKGLQLSIKDILKVKTVQDMVQMVQENRTESA